MFKEQYIKRYGIKKEDIITIGRIKDLIIRHRKSPVEFTKHDQFVICSDDYNMKVVKLDDLKKMISNAKLFIEKINKITSKNEYIFK